MTNDRELLELAAKAAGLEGYRYCTSRRCMAEWVESDGGWFGYSIWSPLTNDGDTFRLEVTLKFAGAWDPESEKWVIGELLRSGKINWLASHNDRKRATTLAAAEYGKILSL
jgi:hypothetical protein